MKKISLLFTMLAAGTLPVFANTHDQEVRLLIPLVATPPAIDGFLGDKAWQDIPWQGPLWDFPVKDRPVKAAVQTRFKAVHDGHHLYFAIQADEPAVDQLVVASRNERDGMVCLDDEVEIFIKPGAAGRYFHFMINHKGTLYDARNLENKEAAQTPAKWNSMAKCGVRIGKKSWEVEFSIDFAELELNADAAERWTINVTRARHAGGKSELSTFAPLPEGGFHQPDKFARSKLVGFSPLPFLWTIFEPDEEMVVRKEGKLIYQAKLRVRNGTDRFYRLILRGEIGQPNKTPSRVEYPLHLTPASDTAEKEMLLQIPLNHEGENQLTFSLFHTSEPDLPVKIFRLTKTLVFAPIQLRVVEPVYRGNYLFNSRPTNKIKVQVTLSLPESEIAGYRLLAQLSDERKTYAKEQVDTPAQTTRVELNVQDLPIGRYRLEASLTDKQGAMLYHNATVLEKLPPHRGEVWFDENGVAYVDGKPFLPFGLYYYTRSPAMKAAYGDLAYCNITVGITEGGDSKTMINPCDVIPDPGKLGALTTEHVVAIKAYVAKFRDNPNFFGWSLPDEPENYDISPGLLQAVYVLIRDLDPYHPTCMINNCIVSMSTYRDTCDILAPDCSYNDFQKDGPPVRPIAVYGQYLRAIKGLGRIPWITQQIFDWRTCSGSKGHEQSRAPTFREFRCEAYEAICNGTKGFWWFAFRFGYHLPDRRLGMPFLATEIDALKKYVLGPETVDGVAIQPYREDFSHALRKIDGQTTLFAVNTIETPIEVEFTLKGMDRNANLFVVSEGRQVALSQGKFKDRFEAYQVHVYTTDAALSKLPTVAEMEGRIQEANAARRKPGNILFENDTVEIKASSLSPAHLYQEYLWYLVDGLSEGRGSPIAYAPWQGAAPAGSPDWVQFSFPEPKTLARVVVYASDLADFLLQVQETDGNWKTIKEVSGNKAERVELVFTSLTVRNLRLLTTGIKGWVYEVEAYQE